MSRTKKGKGPSASQKPASGSPLQNHVTHHVTQAFSGPIPPATELMNYDLVVAGAAERIIRMAEKSQDHQIALEQTAISAQKWEGRIGQIFALTIALAAFGTAITAMVMDYPVVAGVVAGSTVVSLAVAFITGRRSA